MIDKNTFGNTEKYKMLIYITEKFDELDLNKKAHFSKFISDFNKLINNIKISKYDNYILSLIQNDYLMRVENLEYDNKLKTYLKNYIKAKIKNYGV